MELRTYQNKQLNFLQRINECNEITLGVQSPTGTGKTIMILNFIKGYMEKNPSANVVFSTGFNNLVWAIEQESKNFGLDPLVLVGSGLLHPTCTDKEMPLNVTYEHSKTKCANCDLIKYRMVNGHLVFEDNRPEKCAKKLLQMTIDNLTQFPGKLIITNHAYFLAAINGKLPVDLVIFDEAHSMSDFYQSYMTYKETKAMKIILDSYINSVNSPTASIFNYYRNQEEFQGRIIQNMIKELRTNKIVDEMKIDDIQDDITNLYIADKESLIEPNEEGKLIKYRFYYQYEIDCKKIIIMSATLDSYTKLMFGLTNNNNIFVQPEPIDRYKNSEFASIKHDFRESFTDVMKYITDHDNKYNSGLILCTTLDNVEFTCEELAKQYKDKITVYRDIESFKSHNGTNAKVLVGSKAFFQGIDIPDLNWVWLDKIPFANYDNRARAYEFYLKKNTKLEPWTYYTLPMMYNNIIQASGRLWRLNDYEHHVFDDGLFIISDPRLKNKFKYISDNFINMKKGIKQLSINIQENLDL